MDRFVDSLSNIPLHVEKPSVAIRTAQVVGLTSAAYLFGISLRVLLVMIRY